MGIVRSVGKVFVDSRIGYAICRKCGAKIVRKDERKAFWIEMVHSFVRIHGRCRE